MLLAWLNSRRRMQTTNTAEIALAPFPSISSLLSVRRRVGGFAKIRYPKAIAGRRIRDPIIEKMMWVLWSVEWCLFSPVVLFFQMWPWSKLEMRIEMPAPLA